MDISDDWSFDYANQEIDHTAGHAITSVTNANPAVVTMTAHNYTAGDKIFITGVSGMTEINDKWWIVGTVGGANTFNLNDMNDDAYDASGHSAGTGGASAKQWSVNELYSYVMDTFDDLDQMDDDPAMSAQTPTEYTIPDGWNWQTEADAVKFLYGGAITLVDSTNGDDLWANIYSVGAPLADDTQINILQNGSVLTPYWGTGHIDVLVKVKNNGSLIDSGNLVALARESGDTYNNFDVAAPSGRQVAAISTDNDLNDDGNADAVFSSQTGTVSVTAGTTAVTGSGTTFQTQYAAGDYLRIGSEVQRIASITNDTSLTLAANHVAGASGAGHEKSSVKISFAGGYSDDFSSGGVYAYEIDCGGQLLADVYEWTKLITLKDSPTDINGVAGEIYRYVNSTYAEVKANPFGTFAGGKFFTARGIVLTNMNGNDNNNYQLIDNSGTTRTPPVSITATVDKIVSGDKVAIYRLTGAGGSINKTEYTTAATGNNSGSGTVTVQGSIATDTPASGTIRLGSTGKRYEYTSWTGSVFTLSGTTAEDNNSVAAYVPLLEEVATGVSASSAAMTYDADIPALVRVRKYGGAGASIEPFQIEITIGSNGSTTSAIRNDDTVVT